VEQVKPKELLRARSR